MAAEETASTPDESLSSEVRTAVVIVHGMSEQRSMDTLDGFVKTALRPRIVDGEQKWDYYYSRAAEITGSYEARRYIAPQRADVIAPDGEPTERVQGQTEIYEYHWSYLMTGNRFADVMPKTLQLLLRRPSNVPDGLFGIWRVVWIVILAILLLIPTLFVAGYLLNTDVPGWIIGLVVSAVILLFWFSLFRLLGRVLVNKVTTSFVDVARYLDTSPSSYAARRAIRGGLVDLLRALHDGRYTRVVVVGHSLGGYIAYDALTSLWAEMHDLHAGPSSDAQAPNPIPLNSLYRLERAADQLATGGDLDAFQDLQFELWQDLRKQGNPWRITDFVTVGTPMALADFLVARPALFSGFSRSDPALRRELFDGLVRRGALVLCPPRSEAVSVESDERPAVDYRSGKGGARETLGSQSIFAVTRWTNLWFPVIRGELRGDWFGGALRPLFGPGIRDIPVLGNEPERLKRGSANTEYFAHPDKHGEGDAAQHLRAALALQTRAVLQDLLNAPPTEPRAHCACGSQVYDVSAGPGVARLP